MATAGLYDWTARGTATLAGTDVMTHDALGRRTFASGLAVAYDGLDRPVRVTVATEQLATITDGMLEAVEGESCSIPVLCEASGGLLDGPVGDLTDELGAEAVAELVEEAGATDVTGSLSQAVGEGVELAEGSAVYEMAYNGLELDPVDDGISWYVRGPDGRPLLVNPRAGAGVDDPAFVGLNAHGDRVWTSSSRPSDGLRTSAIYGPFGTVAGSSGLPTATTRAGLQADWTDPVSGQVHMGARWYRPSSASFTARDTYAGELTRPVSHNRYLYAHGNPLLNTDPDGRKVCEGTRCDGPTTGTTSSGVPVVGLSTREKAEVKTAAEQAQRDQGRAFADPRDMTQEEGPTICAPGQCELSPRGSLFGDFDPSLGSRGDGWASYRDWEIAPVSGAGVVALDLFIRSESATPLSGDNREFDGSIVGKRSRVRIWLDFEQGEARAKVFGTCTNKLVEICRSALPIGDYTSRPNPTLHNEMRIFNDGSDVRVDFDVVNSITMLGISVDGSFRISPSIDDVQVGYAGDDYPSIEAWHHDNGGEPSMLMGSYEGGHAATSAWPLSSRRVIGIPVD